LASEFTARAGVLRLALLRRNAGPDLRLAKVVVWLAFLQRG
jgi:hypothetical protein